MGREGEGGRKKTMERRTDRQDEQRRVGGPGGKDGRVRRKGGREGRSDGGKELRWEAVMT